jgi:hypothetical protein
MPRYALLADHTPDICPASNAKTRARAMEGLSPENTAKVTQALGIQIIIGPLHLDPSHRTLAIVEAPAIEAVTKFVLETGMFQWNTVEVCPVTPIEEMMPVIMQMPTVYD